MKCFVYGLLGLWLSLLVSCIDGEEEVFLRSDGSGRMKVQYRVPGMIFSDADAKELIAIIDEEVGKKDNLVLVENRVDREHGQKVIRIEVEAASVIELEDMLDDHEDDGDAPPKRSKTDKILHALLGDMQVEISGLTANVKRDVDLQPLLNEYLGRRGGSLLGESEFRYSVHLPKAVTESNAHQVLNDGKTLKWTYKLRECKQKPIVMDMQAPIPVPWWGYALVGGTVFALVWWFFAFLRKSRKKSIA